MTTTSRGLIPFDLCYNFFDCREVLINNSISISMTINFLHNQKDPLNIF